MKLYFVAAGTDEGANYDLHVIADDRATAVDLWRAYYDLEIVEQDDMNLKVQVVLAFEGMDVVHKVRNRDELRDGTTAHVIDWDLQSF